VQWAGMCFLLHYFLSTRQPSGLVVVMCQAFNACGVGEELSLGRKVKTPFKP